MKSSNGRKKIRLQLEFSEKMSELIDRLVLNTDAASRVEVVRRALSIYGVMVDVTREGKQIQTIDPKTKQCESFILTEIHKA